MKSLAEQSHTKVSCSSMSNSIVIWEFRRFKICHTSCINLQYLHPGYPLHPKAFCFRTHAHLIPCHILSSCPTGNTSGCIHHRHMYIFLWYPLNQTQRGVSGPWTRQTYILCWLESYRLQTWTPEWGLLRYFFTHIPPWSCDIARLIVSKHRTPVTHPTHLKRSQGSPKVRTGSMLSDITDEHVSSSAFQEDTPIIPLLSCCVAL